MSACGNGTIGSPLGNGMAVGYGKFRSCEPNGEIVVMVNKILMDTDVWLDLAGDHRKSPVLTALDSLVRTGAVELILPEIVLTEFGRNRERVVERSRRSLSSDIKRVRQAMADFGDEESRYAAIAQLDDLEHQVAVSGEVSRKRLEAIASLMATRPVTVASDNAKLQAVERALSKRAPFHRSKNAMADAVLIQIFVEAVEADRKPETRLFFVTLNTREFSQHNGDQRLPHTDLEPIFQDEKCTYATSIVEIINELDSQLLTELEWEESYSEEPRGLSEILEALHVAVQQVWYNRHLSLRFGVENGDIRIITATEFAKLDGYHPEVVVDEIWRDALAAAKKTEKELGESQLGRWDDFEWGMINGKLSALRWVLGDDWDMLDT